MYFSYQVRQSQEADRQQLRLRAEERREQRRIRQAERAQVLTAFQREHPEITPAGRNPQCDRVGGGLPSTNSQASTVVLNELGSGAGVAQQRTLVGAPIQLRANNRDLGNIDSSANAAILNTRDNDEHLLEEDFDDEMMIGNTGGNGINQRVTNYEYAQM